MRVKGTAMLKPTLHVRGKIIQPYFDSGPFMLWSVCDGDKVLWHIESMSKGASTRCDFHATLMQVHATF